MECETQSERENFSWNKEDVRGFVVFAVHAIKYVFLLFLVEENRQLTSNLQECKDQIKKIEQVL